MITPSVHSLYLVNRLLCSPLEAMFAFLIFIISKDAGATPLQAAVLVASKPMVSLIAFYANSFIIVKPALVRPFLMTINLIGCLPCLFFPYFHNPWFFVASFALFTATSRASFPAWTQILKSCACFKTMSQSVSKGSSINYTTALFLPLAFSYWMDLNRQIWPFIYLFLSLLYMINLLVLTLVEIKPNETKAVPLKSNFQHVITPWRDALRVLKESTSFAKYLIVFFVGGVGIVMMQSILPTFFIEDLNLSYTLLASAFSFCKGISFLIASPYWAKYANRVSLYFINGIMNILTCLFIAFILASKLYLGWLYVAYLMYGAMQAGSDITWNLSGPHFSRDKECTSYSNLNLVLVGLRGCICPALSQFMFFYFGKMGVFGASFGICFIGTIYAFWLDRQYAQSTVTMTNS